LLALLKKAYGDEFELSEFEWLLGRIEADLTKQQVILEQIEKGVNTVRTSSAGRVFDAVAAVLGIGSYNHFDAQLPMAIEAIIETGVEERYDYELVNRPGEPVKLDLRKTIRELIGDVRAEVPGGIISAKFHNCLAAGLLEMAKAARQAAGLNTAALSGGMFCNQYLTNRLVGLLEQSDFDVLFNRNVPSNDGGISLGQAAIAARVTRTGAPPHFSQ
jgi:hydrogenase maturation protein HypF